MIARHFDQDLAMHMRAAQKAAVSAPAIAHSLDSGQGTAGSVDPLAA
jgi:hypothetical protein